MALSAGEKLGPYEILAPLGAGGMGEVYKARDTRLNRFVAIKVLPVQFAERGDLQQRFEREARAVASLNHPHICVLHDIGNREGAGYIVMEYMEGETLEVRITRGALPLDEALKFAVQIADALDRAHRAGVIHRDVKPANIMLTRDGVKVLDFGLAKSTPKSNPTEETVAMAVTTEGSVLGTPQYMAPEQFEGKEADARSDIWAFGAVTYEMVSGRKAFQGTTYPSLVSAILSADPPPMQVQPFTPAWLERLVQRCLAKDPERRYQSIRDVLLDLEMPPREATRPVRTSHWPWMVAAVCLLAAMFGWGEWLRNSGEEVRPVKLEVDPPWGSHFTTVSAAGGSAISPDGRTLAFVATNAKGESLLQVRPLDSLEARTLPGTENAGKPFWSPDSKWIAFVANGKLKRMDVVSGVPTTLCDERFARGGTWSADGVILFGDVVAGLQRIPASGGTPSAVTQVNKDAGETHHYYPQFLPGGRDFLYLVRHVEREKMEIRIGSLDNKPGTPGISVMQTPFNAAYDAGTRRLVYMNGTGILMARRLDLGPPKLIGDPETVAEDVSTATPVGYADFSISNNGSLFYARGSAVGKVRFAWRDRTGNLSEMIDQPMDAGIGFGLSPDGSRVSYAVASNPGQAEVWVLDLANGLHRRIPLSTSATPRWSPDGKWLYYTNAKGIYQKSSDGIGEEELVLKGSVADVVQSVSPDGKNLLYGNVDIMTLPLTGERKPEAYLKTKYRETAASFSPDGRWVAYDSDESGQHEIYVQGFPERRGKWPISGVLGSFPQWRADGKELYWIGHDNTLMAQPVELQGAGVRPGRAEALFKLDLRFYQPGRDGRRFLVYAVEGTRQDWPMVVQLNWARRLGK